MSEYVPGERYDDLSEYNWLAGEVDLHETPQALRLGALLLETLAPATVLDVGCSSGIYLVPFMEAGCSVLGIDGAPDVGRHIPGRFKVVDLRHPWTPPVRFDLTLCIEVGEHLRREYHENLVKVLTDSSDTIFFSAAHVGQGGEGHYGEAPPEYWFDLFARAGHGLDRPMTETLHAVIDNDSAFEHCHWLRWHSHILRKGL